MADGLIKERVAFIINTYGLTLTQLAPKVGVSAKALRAYELGQYEPKKQHVIDNIYKLSEGFSEANGSVITEDSPPSEREFSPEKLTQYQAQKELDDVAMAALVGVNVVLWRRWKSGKAYPTKKINVKALRKAFKASGSASETHKGRSKGGTHKIAVATAHDLANEFYERYQPRIDNAVIDYAITLVCDTHNVDKRTLRKLVAALLLLLKDRFTPQELYAQLSGHS